MTLRTLLTPSTLAVCGVALWAYGASEFTKDGAFNFLPNPLGLKMSPYGQVIAMAAQGSITADWEAVEMSGAPLGTRCTCGHDHSDGSHDECQDEDFITVLEKAATERTNPNSVTLAHKRYLKRQAEDKLRIAYELDPSNFANYNSYYLFLTEPQVGTRQILTDKALELCKNTVDYCLKQDDPRAALTAASASASILELMFLHKETFTLDKMREEMKRLDYTLSREQEIRQRWIDAGEYEQLSPKRQAEFEERLAFIARIRDASAGTIKRLSQAPDRVEANNHN